MFSSLRIFFHFFFFLNHAPPPELSPLPPPAALPLSAAPPGWPPGRGDPPRVRPPRRLALRVPVRGRPQLLEQPSDIPARPWPAATAAALPPPDAKIGRAHV